MAPAAKKRRVVCESCSLVGHMARKSQKCKYSTNVKSKFYGNLSPAAFETAKSKTMSEIMNNTVSWLIFARMPGFSDTLMPK
jgi:hypothetical protein